MRTNIYLFYMDNTFNKMRKNSPLQKYSPHKTIERKYLSPQYPTSAVLLSQEKDFEQKLHKKIHKLKHSLKLSEKHNEQLHSKLRLYRDSCQQLERALKIKQKQFEEYQSMSMIKIDKLHRSNREYEELFDKNLTNKGLLKQEQLRTIKKITELQNIKQDLSQALQHSHKKVTNMEQLISSMKQKYTEEEAAKWNKLQKDVALKITESHQTNRQIYSLKQSLKDSLSRLQKQRSQSLEHNLRNKQLSQDNKELKKLISIYQKQSSSYNQSMENNKVDLLKNMQKIGNLEKIILEKQYENKTLDEKLREISEKYKIQIEQKQKICSEYETLMQKHNQLITTNYQLQRDFERELHTIVKQLTRRHIVSKSIINSTTSSSICLTPQKESMGQMHSYNINGENS